MHVLQGSVVFFLALSVTFVNFRIGLGENIDSFLIWLRAQHWSHTGDYMSSRSWGFPLYEALAYPILARMGIGVAKCYSFFWVVISIVAFFGILRQSGLNRKRSLAGVLAFAWLPCTIISSNTILETAQSASLGLVSVYFVTRFFNSSVQATGDSRDFSLGLAFVTIGFAAATRPCHVISLVALVMTALIFGRARIGRIMMWTGVAAMIAVVPYLLLYKQSPFHPGFTIIETGDPFEIRLVKAVIGYAAELGLPVWAMILGWSAAWLWRKPLITSTPLTPWGVFITLVSVFYAMRMLLLPDEVEYIYFWAALFLAYVIPKMRKSSLIWALAAAALLPNLVQLHLFERNQVGAIHFSPGISPGVFVQESERRALQDYMRTEFAALTLSTWRELGCEEGKFAASDLFIELFPKGTNANCVISSVKWYARMRDHVFPNQSRDMERYLARYSKTILIHNLPTDRGWRRFLKFEESFPVPSERLGFRIRRPGMPVGDDGDTCFWTGQGCRM